jgi:hypothetical protein
VYCDSERRSHVRQGHLLRQHYRKWQATEATTCPSPAERTHFPENLEYIFREMARSAPSCNVGVSPPTDRLSQLPAEGSMLLVEDRYERRAVAASQLIHTRWAE